ncbi:uncharacterized protein LOC130671177 [Microplitis mediator]|uniref:uncharacterized protein LOC130671177 n=1 Tax=Microplitis mediator TaxID=375433 RepID=UPI0025545035|nr:uncharacterized protein LOC130671177 [Microplitis mediator]
MDPNVELIILNEPPAAKLNYNNIFNESVPTRIIELSDYKTKLELRREFNLDSYEIENRPLEFSYNKINNNPTKTIFNMSNNVILPKLPAGTIIIKQDDKNKFSKNKIPSRNTGKIESIIGKIKSMKKNDKTKTAQIQRTPLRSAKKKSDDTFTRLRLLSTKRSGRHNDGGVNKKQLKRTDIPYMNTRSITKKLYNIGATFQAPTVYDEMEWKEWPVHGMHDRPIYHPQIGLGTEFIGRCFVNVDNRCYKQVLHSSKIGLNVMNNENTRHNKRRTYSYEKKNKIKEDKTFADYMHDSLHYVLAYCAQIMTPQYRKLITEHVEIKKSESMEKIINKTDNPTNVKISLDNLKGNSFYLQEINSSSGETSKVSSNKLLINFKNIKNHEKLQQALESGSKNTFILLKTTIPSSKKDINNCRVVKPDTLTNAVAKIEHYPKNDGYDTYLNLNQVKCCALQSHKKYRDPNPTEAKLVNDELLNGNWINELIQNTAMIYCFATGVHQDDVINYINTLDANQSINWLMSQL